jgi:hypothetical protein
MTAAQITDLDKAQQHFDRARRRVVEVTSGLSDAQWRFKTAPDRWSIAENLEHMVLVHERVFEFRLKQLAQAPAPPAHRNYREIDRLAIEKIQDRSIKAQAPDFIRPTGQLNPEEALQRLFQNYERLAKFVESTPGLREHILDAPPLRIVTDGAYDTLDGYQWALTLASHDLRHAEQIAELKADPNYPR